MPQSRGKIDEARDYHFRLIGYRDRRDYEMRQLWFGLIGTKDLKGDMAVIRKHERLHGPVRPHVLTSQWSQQRYDNKTAIRRAELAATEQRERVEKERRHEQLVFNADLYERIAQGKVGNRSRGASPAVPASGNAQPQQQQATFSNNFTFAFGNPQNQSQNGDSPFQFGMSAPAPANSFAPQLNGTNNPFAQSAAPSFGSNMNTSAASPAQNGFTFGSSFGSTQPSSQQTNTTSFGGFGQTQPTTTTPMTATSSTFGSFGKPQDQNGTNATQQSSTFGGFGATQQQPTNTASTFGGFGATQQEKQNGFTSGGAFGQQPQADTSKQKTPSFGVIIEKPQETSSSNNTSTAFGGFGQKAKETAMPSTASTTFSAFGQKPQQNGEKTSSTFGGFGQKAPASSQNPNPVFGGFGQQKAAESSGQPSTTFGGFGQKAPENSAKPAAPFGGFGQKPQENGDKAANMFGTVGKQSAQDTQKSSNPFASDSTQQPNGNKEMNAQPPTGNTLGQPQQERQQTSSQTQVPKMDMVDADALQDTSQPPQQASNPATSNIFGSSALSQPAQSSGENKGLFGSSLMPMNAPKGTGSVLDSIKNAPSKSNFSFSSADPSQVYRPENDPDNEENEEESSNGNIFGQSAPKPAAEQRKSNIFGGSLFPDKSQESTDPNIPPLSMFKNYKPQGSDTPPANPPSKPRSLLERMEPADQAKILAASKPTSPQKSLFDKVPETPAQAMFAPQTPATSKPQSMFAPQTASTTPAASSSLFQPAQTSIEAQTPKAPSLFEKPTSQPSKSGPFTPAPSQPAAPSTAIKAPATAPPARAAAAPPSQVTKATGAAAAAEDLSKEQKERLKSLNRGMLSHLKTQNAEQDWTSMFQYYMQQAATIRGVAPPTMPAAPTSLAKASAPASVSSGSLLSAQKPTAPKAIESSTNLFSQGNKTASASTSTAQTPKQPDTGNMFKPPATAPPASKKRLFEEDDDDEPAQVPGTEKRSKPNEPSSYPKLPETASSAAKLFESSLDKSKSAATSQPTASDGFNPSTKSMFSSATNQATTNQTPAATASAPAFKMPTFTAPASGNSFLSAFGKKADAEGEKERKKRKADDYDSDDETPEEWEKRDREQQEAKRLKIMEAGKSGGGFKFASSTSPTKAITAKEVEKAQGPGDNTWKPETPIKFGASTADTSMTPAVPPPKFGMFGAATPSSSSTETGKLAPPTTGAGFGPKTASLATSRATTPGVTTDGEASTAGDGNEDGEPSDEQKDAQINTDDMTGLLPAERQENEVLLELQNVKSKKLVKKEGEEKTSWVSMGDGRAYLLKNKANGKIRILQKVGLGKLALNFEPFKGAKYEAHPKKDTMIMGPFLDHIHCQPAKLDRFFINTETADDAKELLRILTEGASQ